MNVHEIPPMLYRGDADKHGTRKLRTTIDYLQFHTNLIEGGEGRKIFETPLRELINLHVGLTWPKTHFLSFTEEVLTAYKYGSSNFDLQENEIDLLFSEYYDVDIKWNFALLELNCREIRWNQLDYGVFEGRYKPQLTKFAKEKVDYRILLLHVETILSRTNDNSFQISLAKSKADKEWLLLPATPLSLNFGQNEFSAILDGACINYKKISQS